MVTWAAWVEWAAWASKLLYLTRLGFDPDAPERQKIQTSVWIFLCLNMTIGSPKGMLGFTIN